MQSPRQGQGSPQGPPNEAPLESPRQAHNGGQLCAAQSSPPNLPSPLPLRSSGSPSPSNMPLDHLLMLANLTNGQPEDMMLQNTSPNSGNQPSMHGAGNYHPAYRRALSLSPPPQACMRALLESARNTSCLASRVILQLV